MRLARSARTTLDWPIHAVSRKLFSPLEGFKAKRYGESGRHTFFGYYDLTPFDANEQILLAGAVRPVRKLNLSDTPLQIGYFDLREPNPDFRSLDETTTWCWQQGCRLQWFPDKAGQAVIYNRVVDNSYGCIIQDIRTKEPLRAFHRPVYAVDREGRWGLSLNFSRLQRLRPGYGYANFPDATEGENAPDHDGIWRINLGTGEENLLLSVKQISAWEPLPSMAGAVHYFNHLGFNPSSSRFLFFHAWVQNGKRYARLITTDLDGRNLYPLINEGLVAHYAWKSDNELLAFSSHADTGTQYHLYCDQSPERTVFGRERFDQDGHPSFSPDGSTLLLDTYPDKNRYQHLSLYKMATGEFLSLGSFFSPMKYFGAERCDLHPRWSPRGNYICFDSAHDGARGLYVMEKPQAA